MEGRCSQMLSGGVHPVGADVPGRDRVRRRRDRADPGGRGRLGHDRARRRSAPIEPRPGRGQARSPGRPSSTAPSWSGSAVELADGRGAPRPALDAGSRGPALRGRGAGRPGHLRGDPRLAPHVHRGRPGAQPRHRGHGRALRQLDPVRRRAPSPASGHPSTSIARPRERRRPGRWAASCRTSSAPRRTRPRRADHGSPGRAACSSRSASTEAGRRRRRRPARPLACARMRRCGPASTELSRTHPRTSVTPTDKLRRSPDSPGPTADVSARGKADVACRGARADHRRAASSAIAGSAGCAALVDGQRAVQDDTRGHPAPRRPSASLRASVERESPLVLSAYAMPIS